MVATRALGRGFAEVAVFQGTLQPGHIDPTAGTPLALTIEVLTRALLAPQVQQDVPRAAIKATGAGAMAQDADVGHATHIEHGARLAIGPKAGLVKRHHQGGTLAAGGQIAVAQIRHHVYTGEFSQQSRVIELPGVTQIRAVTHRLPMRADGPHAARTDARLAHQIGHHLRLHLGQLDLHQRGTMQLVGSARVEVQKRLPEGLLPRRVHVAYAMPLATGSQLHEHAVDAVHRSARHQADVAFYRPSRIRCHGSPHSKWAMAT